VPPSRGGFYHITPVSNLPTILEHGLYSHTQLVRRKILFSVAYDSNIVERRGRIPTGTRRSLHEYVNLYLNPRNAMMYLVKVIERCDVAVVQVNSRVLDRKDVWLTDGNAAANATSFHPVDMKTLAQLRHQVDCESWNDPDESLKAENKRKMMAECLVPVHISPELIEVVYFNDLQSADKVIQSSSGVDIRLLVYPYLFFSSEKKGNMHSVAKPQPVSHPRSNQQHRVKVAIQHTKTPDKEVFASSATKPPAAPEDTSAATTLLTSPAVLGNASAPTRRMAQQNRKSESWTPVHSAAVSLRTNRKVGKSKLWELFVFLLKLLFILALYEVIRGLRI